jgi:hypothetical protein
MTSERKNLRRAFGDNSVSLKEGESIMQVVSLRGSNLIEAPTHDKKDLVTIICHTGTGL